MAKRTKKSNSNKPSELLKRALELFGPKGEFWIQGNENETLYNAFYEDGKLKDNDDVNFYFDIFSVNSQKDVDKAIEQLSKLKYVGDIDAYCSIGAVNEVDTSNRDKAVVYLATAINPKEVAEERKNPKFVKGDYYDESDLASEVEHIIIDKNDSSKVKFPQIKKYFQKAIKLAQKNGE